MDTYVTHTWPGWGYMPFVLGRYAEVDVRVGSPAGKKLFACLGAATPQSLSLSV
jgi:hypothetical protein